MSTRTGPEAPGEGPAATEIADPDGARAPGCRDAAGEDSEGLKARLRRHEIQIILEALAATGGNQTEAAKRLRIPLRTLTHKMKTMGIRRRGYAVE